MKILAIPANICAIPAVLDPRKGVPKKTIPVVDLRISSKPLPDFSECSCADNKA